MSETIQLATLTPGLLHPAVAIASVRAGVLDFEYVNDYDVLTEAIRRLELAARAPFGILMHGDTPDLVPRVMADLPPDLKTIILTDMPRGELRDQIGFLRERPVTTIWRLLAWAAGISRSMRRSPHRWPRLRFHSGNRKSGPETW